MAVLERLMPMTDQDLSGRRIFVTGAAGMLGSEFVNRLDAAGATMVAVTRQNLDLDFPERAADHFRAHPCDTVIHCAAETNVDACEGDPAMALRRNCETPLSLARSACDAGAKFVFVSSSGVFDGKKPDPYDESDVPAPCTAYAASKVAAERILMEQIPSVLIIRAGWMFGGSATQKKNFVAARWREAQGRAEVVSAGDKTGSPTWTRDLVGLVWDLIRTDATGIFHTVNSGSATRAEYVAEILRLCQIPATVRPVSSREFPRSAAVPDNEALVSVRREIPLRPWREALADYIAETGRTFSA